MLLVIQGTPFCNINCSYCYLPQRDDKRRIAIDTIRQTVSRLIDFARAGGMRGEEAVNVVWHAGEPLVLPVSFYEEAFAAFAPLQSQGIAVSQSFQTNGMLIDAGWPRFFRDHQAIIGVSLDGPEEIHDLHRRARNGTGSWARAMAGIGRLREAGLPFHVIAVLTAEALRQPDAMFDFFDAAGLHDLGFNIEETEGVHLQSSLAMAAPLEAVRLYSDFLRRFLARNATAGHPIRLREAEGAAAAMLEGAIPHNPQVEAGRILSVDVAGNVATFSPELLGLKDPRYGDFIIGNVGDQGLAEMLGGPVATAMTRDIAAGIAKCRESCAFFDFCKGGAPVNKLCETGSFNVAETMHCRLTVQATMQTCLDTIHGALMGAA